MDMATPWWFGTATPQSARSSWEPGRWRSRHRGSTTEGWMTMATAEVQERDLATLHAPLSEGYGGLAARSICTGSQAGISCLPLRSSSAARPGFRPATHHPAHRGLASKSASSFMHRDLSPAITSTCGWMASTLASGSAATIGCAAWSWSEPGSMAPRSSLLSPMATGNPPRAGPVF